MTNSDTLIHTIIDKINAGEPVSNDDLGITAYEFDDLLDRLEHDHAEEIHSQD